MDNRSSATEEPPYLTPLHSEVEKIIGQIMKRDGDTTHLDWLALANRCSQIIKGFEERIATGELSAPSATQPTVDPEEKRRQAMEFLDGLIKEAENATPEERAAQNESLQSILKAIEYNRSGDKHSGEPVAWRWRIDTPGMEMDWVYADWKPTLGTSPNWVLQPLYAQSATEGRLRLRMDKGPWRYDAESRIFYSGDFEHDVMLKLGGDFADDEQRIRYASDLLAVLALASSSTRSEHG